MTNENEFTLNDSITLNNKNEQNNNYATNNSKSSSIKAMFQNFLKQT